jgi:hypothetical protein
MSKETTKGFCCKLSPADHAVLERCAKKTGKSMSAAVRTLIRAYLVPQLREGVLFPGIPHETPDTSDLFYDQVEGGK